MTASTTDGSFRACVAGLALAALTATSHAQSRPPQSSLATRPSSVYLDRITWTDAEHALTPDAVVVITTAAASKEHGPHLPLSADFLQAEFVKQRVAERTSVVVAPSIPYGYYPPFAEYPGSTTLRLTVFRELLADICRSIARTSSARRFYIISHGPVSVPVMEQLRAELATEGLLVGFTDWDAAKRPVAETVRQQERGSHADEMETSMLLYIAPQMVDMRRAAREYGAPSATGGRMIGNRPANNGVFSPSGVFGDATVATRDKGQQLTEAVIAATVANIDALRAAPLPPVVPLDAFFAGLDGPYRLGSGDTIHISHDGNLLALERVGRPRALLQPAGKYRFGLWATEIHFLTDDSGAVTHLVLSEGGKDMLATRIR